MQEKINGPKGVKGNQKRRRGRPPLERPIVSAKRAVTSVVGILYIYYEIRTLYIYLGKKHNGLGALIENLVFVLGHSLIFPFIVWARPEFSS